MAKKQTLASYRKIRHSEFTDAHAKVVQIWTATDRDISPFIEDWLSHTTSGFQLPFTLWSSKIRDVIQHVLGGDSDRKKRTLVPLAAYNCPQVDGRASNSDLLDMLGINGKGSYHHIKDHIFCMIVIKGTARFTGASKKHYKELYAGQMIMCNLSKIADIRCSDGTCLLPLLFVSNVNKCEFNFLDTYTRCQLCRLLPSGEIDSFSVPSMTDESYMEDWIESIFRLKAAEFSLNTTRQMLSADLQKSSLEWHCVEEPSAVNPSTHGMIVALLICGYIPLPANLGDIATDLNQRVAHKDISIEDSDAGAKEPERDYDEDDNSLFTDQLCSVSAPDDEEPHVTVPSSFASAATAESTDDTKNTCDLSRTDDEGITTILTVLHDYAKRKNEAMASLETDCKRSKNETDNGKVTVVNLNQKIGSMNTLLSEQSKAIALLERTVTATKTAGENALRVSTELNDSLVLENAELRNRQKDLEVVWSFVKTKMDGGMKEIEK